MRPGAPYRPSNGTEALWFLETYCDRCVHELGGGCLLLEESLLGGQPEEWVYREDDEPTCTRFEAVEGEERP